MTLSVNVKELRISYRIALLWILLDIIVIMWTSDIVDIRYMQDGSFIYNFTVVELVLWYKKGLRRSMMKFVKCVISSSINKRLLNEGELYILVYQRAVGELDVLWYTAIRSLITL